MTALFMFGGAAIFYGAASMNAVLLLAGGLALAISVTVIDDRQQRKARERSARLEAERMARGNGHPKGNVDLVARSGNE